MQIEYKRTFVLHPIILLEAAIAKRLVILGLPQAGPSNSKDG